MRRLARAFVRLNKRLAEQFDKMLPDRYNLDGASAYANSIVPRFLRPGAVVYDVGGGRSPLVGKNDKERLGLRCIGVDVSVEELRASPEGSYDRVYVGDIMLFSGNADADLVICRAVLEHVPNVRAAFRGLTSLLKPGGRLTLYVPCRNALYARVNLLLGERLKRWLLFAFHPQTKAHQGFPSYYDDCTPDRFRQIATEHGLLVEEQATYVYNFYFSFFFPLHLAYRGISTALHRLFGERYCEGFTMCLRKATSYTPCSRCNPPR